MNTTTVPASSKQHEYLRYLADTRLAKNGKPLGAALVAKHGSLDQWLRAEAATKDDASEVITKILLLPVDPNSQHTNATNAQGNGPVRTSGGYSRTRADKPDPPVGLYKVGNTVYRLKLSKTSKKVYAETVSWQTGPDGKAHSVTFSYVGRRLTHPDGSTLWIDDLQPQHVLTPDQAGALGLTVGTCLYCGRTLTDEKSVERGIGPVCAGHQAKTHAHFHNPQGLAPASRKPSDIEALVKWVKDNCLNG